MKPEEAKAIIFQVLGDIAPEIDPMTVNHSLDLTEQLDLDSIDYLNWMLGISESVGIDIPQRDVSRFLTIDGAAEYVVGHASPGGA
jgi:acyl carrier protein